MIDDFIQIFDEDFAAKLQGRAATFRAVMREALSIGASCIVETGCMRQLDNWAGDGQSTLLWSKFFFHAKIGFVNSVDIDENATRVAMDACKAYPHTSIYCMDSVEFLYKFKGSIDLLYLDSFDLDKDNPHAAALHAFKEFCAAMPKLHKKSIVFVDDSPMINGEITGKGKYVAEFFRNLRVHPFTFGYQVAWRMP